MHHGPQLERGEGGPPTPSLPSQGHPWPLSLIGSFPSHGTFLFSIKTEPQPRVSSSDHVLTRDASGTQWSFRTTDV